MHQNRSKIMSMNRFLIHSPSNAARSHVDIASIATIEAFTKVDLATHKFSLCKIDFNALEYYKNYALLLKS